MPIYEYECLECKIEFEKIVRTSTPSSEISCPVCGSRGIEEKISAFSSFVKGGAPSKSGSCAPGGG